MLYVRYLNCKNMWRVYNGERLSTFKGIRGWTTREWMLNDLKTYGYRLEEETGRIVKA